MCDITDDDPPTYGVFDNMAAWLRRRQHGRQPHCPDCGNLMMDYGTPPKVWWECAFCGTRQPDVPDRQVRHAG